MFEYLIKIDDRLYERYLTVERNIKSASNSFYDSYLDMQEQFVKTVAINENIEISVRATCGELLHNNDVKNYFINVIKLDDYTFNKMNDYSLKVNAHKHVGEKRIQVETIVNYLRVFYTASSLYYQNKIEEACVFNADEIISIFGIYEKDNIALKEEVNKLKEDLSVSIESGKIKESDIIAYKNLLSQAEIDKLSLEDQNSELQKQVSKLKDIKLSSMEEKLNKTIDLLNELTESVIENRVVSYAVGDCIMGRERFEKFVESAKEKIKHE